MKNQAKRVLMFGLMIAVAMSMLLPNVSEAAAKKPAAVKAKTVKVYKSTSNTKTATVKVKWKKAKNAKKYRVAYKEKGKKSWKKVTTKKTAVTLKNLKGNTKYSVKVRSLNGKKYSKYSKAKTFKTKKLVKKPSKPDEPKPPIDEKPELKIDKSEVTLYVKDGYTATVTASGIDADKLTWESSDEAVATVENGVITPVGEGKAVISVSGEDQKKECQVTVKSSAYQYVTAKDVLTSLASGNSEYELIDVRQNIDKSGLDMGSYTKAHVISALGAPMMSDEYDYLAADQCVENLKKVGLSNENGKKHVFICYYGGEIAEIGVKVARSLMGINNDDIYILESGQWSMDPEWSSMAKNPYEAPQYLIGMGTLKTGEAVQNMTKSQLTTAMTGEIKICNVLDVRVKADYDADHIDGAVSASVKENDGSALKEEVQKAGKTSVFVLVGDGQGEDVAEAYQKMLGYGVATNQIVVLDGGMSK